MNSPDELRQHLARHAYLADTRVAVSAFLALRLGRPLLLEGPAGVGKTSLALALSRALSAPLVRLQCYEGLDETRALYEWEYPKQLLYAQLLRSRLDDLIADAPTLSAAVERIATHDAAFFQRRFLLERPLLRAITAPTRTVLLVDEVDRSDPEFEAFLLEVLAEMQVTIPELGTITATTRPLVLLTSNASRELSDALRRRCLHLALGYPDLERELAIVREHVPGIEESLARAVVDAVAQLRALELRKPPSVGETIDWARSLQALGALSLDAAAAEATLGVVVKHAADEDVALAALKRR
jgi:MoxR-like ATPase